MQYINTSAYKFISLDDLVTRQETLKHRCEDLGIKGTILLSAEGINLNLVGTEQSIREIEQYLHTQPEFNNLWFKHSPSSFMTFERLKVRIKNEIITFKQDSVKPEQHTVKHLSAEIFKQWLDEERDIVVLDTRNDYEIEYGHFNNAVDLNIDNFTEFTQAVAEQLSEHKDKTVVMYCTGGVRCEKAGPAIEELGFDNVYQLNGGILAYFEACGGAHYHGDCFVFDDRIAVTPKLKEIGPEKSN